MRSRRKPLRPFPLTVALVAACILLASGICLGYSEAWSPDATRVLYLYRIDTDTYAVAILDRESGETREVRRFPKAVWVHWVGWGPDGETAVLIAGGQILQLDPSTWDAVHAVDVDDPIGDAVIVGRYLFFLTGAKRQSLVRLELGTDGLQHQEVRVSHIFSDGNRLYYVSSPGKRYRKESHVFGQIDLDTLTMTPEFQVPAHSRRAVGHPLALGERIAFVSAADDERMLNVFRNNELERSIPLGTGDKTPLVSLMDWSAADRICVVFLEVNDSKEPDADAEVRETLVTRNCEFDIESGSKTCKTASEDPDLFGKDVVLSISFWEFLFSFADFSVWTHGPLSAGAAKSCFEPGLMSHYGAEIAHPSKSYALPPDYAQLGRGVVLSGYEDGSDMSNLSAVRSRLSRYLKKQGITVANDPKEFSPLIAGEIRLPLLVEKIKAEGRELLLHLTLYHSYPSIFSNTMKLECLDSSGNSRWVEEVSAGGLFVPSGHRVLWKGMKKKLALHVDELRREAGSADF